MKCVEKQQGAHFWGAGQYQNVQGATASGLGLDGLDLSASASSFEAAGVYRDCTASSRCSLISDLPHALPGERLPSLTAT